MVLARRAAAGTASLAVAALLALLGASTASAAAGDILLASRADGAAGAKGNGPAALPSVSAEGRFVAFESAATNLDPADTDASLDVYVRDAQTNVTALASRAGGASGVKSNGDCTAPDVSADRRYVTFRCTASNLDSADSDATADIFVRDLFARTTTLVSRAGGPGGVKGNGDCDAPSISADGRYVAFESVAGNLDPADTDATSDIFVRDLQANTTTLVSRAGAKGDGASTQPSISSTGRYVAFSSLSTNLHADDVDAAPDVFMRDVQSSATTLVSRAATASGAKGDGDSTQPGISADGRWVAFISTSTNLDGADSDAIADVFVRGVHANTSTTTLVSRADGPNGAKANGDSAAPTISTTGRYVAFSSISTNLDPADADAVSDVYSRELPSNNVRLLSRAAGVSGIKGDRDSVMPAISADARFVAFASAAANLGDGDLDATGDVHVRDVLGSRPPFVPSGEGAPQSPGASNAPAASIGCSVNAAPSLFDGDIRPGEPDTDILVGLGGSDVLRGFAGTDILFGMGGNDVLHGFAGDDCLYGQHGNDRLSGGSGNDRLYGGRGDDRLRGGPGRDVLHDRSGRDRFSGGAGSDLVEARDRTRADRRRADDVSCGTGTRDRAFVDRDDRVSRDCENVVRRRR